MRITIFLSILLFHLVVFGHQAKTKEKKEQSNEISNEHGKDKNSLQKKLDLELKKLTSRGKINFPKRKQKEKNKEQSNMRQTTDIAHFINEITTTALRYAQNSGHSLVIDEKFCPFRKVKCDKKNKYRSEDGICNNLDSPLKGSANTPYKRILSPANDDNLNSPRSKSVSGQNLPNPRTISLNLSPPSNANSFEMHVSQIYALFGQFFIHDSALTSATTDKLGDEIQCTCESEDSVCFSVVWPANDMYLDQKCMKVTRSSATFPDFDCSVSYREQLNLLSSFIDGSAIYGLNKERSDELRTLSQGLMKTSEPTINGVKVTNGSYLPLSDDTCSATDQTTFNCFKAGEVRTSENLALVSMHTLFLREHNRVAKILAILNPSWNDEKLYQETRNIVIAILQHIIYNEWLPMVIGDNSLSPDLTKTEYYSGYDSNVKLELRPLNWPHNQCADKTIYANFGDNKIFKGKKLFIKNNNKFKTLYLAIGAWRY
ncbi:chorion peroxidase [Brachionus plicatilis]|uniref:Chorion peroxidase n=1 Tax=Brachionus plicatilis TaxID=10195 RepID=A0A3M7QAR0_BRAPC|nr:chorion peroxidase [Brachionus plicatilis]